ncbi:ATPase AAA-type core [Penicillium robsamsonii]|uniref:ATPase AAA-type core n=1 Tax=Penicillium robsamsonii TaxID=1792511 RepID=UPI00254978E1|nr:ATPase AAA-type core [Penicillium robsamsonii]KAJ5835547.1 ATPase AAA-type core [Penicillium robsamsonii]
MTIQRLKTRGWLVSESPRVPYLFSARLRDKLYMTNTISEDLSKAASQEQPIPASSEGRAPPPLFPL